MEKKRSPCPQTIALGHAAVSKDIVLAQDPGFTPDAAFITALQTGDHAAFEKLVRLYGGRLYAVPNRFLINEEEARDAVQDAFLSTFSAIDRFKGQVRVSAWLHRITVNAALIKLRTRRRKGEESIDELVPMFQEDGHRTDACPEWRQPTEELLRGKESTLWSEPVLISCRTTIILSCSYATSRRGIRLKQRSCRD